MLLDEAGKKMTKNSVPFVQCAMEQTIAVFDLAFSFTCSFSSLSQKRGQKSSILLLLAWNKRLTSEEAAGNWQRFEQCISNDSATMASPVAVQ